jgi:hypothetical protein
MSGETAPPEREPHMSNEIAEQPPLREGDCPFCERTVLVHEEPPRCPLCACPIDATRMRPFSFPAEQPGET